MYAVESARRVVLGWSSYVGADSVEVDALAAEIAAFFGSRSEPGSDDGGLLKPSGPMKSQPASADKLQVIGFSAKIF
jgi:hypothetical protein